MALYSRFRGDGSGYDYYESDERFGLGDDLATPQLTAIGELGVPSTEIGRLPKGKLRRVGQGQGARGHVMPLDRTGLSDASATEPGMLSPSGWFFVGGVAVGALGLWLWQQQRRRRA